ncbi:hypothetical protein [Photobacterium leiognathi]|uniref:hypothetical protein n=1 Tax=Photobacterium leiognathi TaxID=553611 RepID=UPI00273A19CC|nr:hypothetical protein [Photobacterium leiognathi]
MTIQRSKWYQLRTKLSLTDISGRLRDYSYEQSDPFGFDLIRISDSSISIRYSEKFMHVDSFLNVYGEEVISETVRYKIINFSISIVDEDRYLIHIESSPRSILDFFYNFKMVLNTDISLNLVSIKILDFLESLKDRDDIKQFKIKKAIFSGITVTPKSKAKIEISSSQNALLDFEKKYHVNGYVVDKINCHFRFNGEDVSLELRKTGTFSHSKKLTSLLNNEIWVAVKSL